MVKAPKVAAQFLLNGCKNWGEKPLTPPTPQKITMMSLLIWDWFEKSIVLSWHHVSVVILVGTRPIPGTRLPTLQRGIWAPWEEVGVEEDRVQRLRVLVEGVDCFASLLCEVSSSPAGSWQTGARWQLWLWSLMTAERDGREWTSDTSGQRFTQTGKTQGRRFPPQRFSQRSSVVLFVLLLDYLKKRKNTIGNWEWRRGPS